MDPRLLYWSWALVNMVCVVGCALEGVRRIRRRDVEVHRRLMVTAGILVALFVVSYAFKLQLLGKEDLASWSEASILLLRVHETCVLAMLAGGGYAGILAYRFLRNRPVAGGAAPSNVRRRRSHRRAGWVAVLASSLGVLTAAFVLQGMYSRAEAPYPAGVASQVKSVSLAGSAAEPLEVLGELPDEG